MRRDPPDHGADQDISESSGCEPPKTRHGGRRCRAVLQAGLRRRRRAATAPSPDRSSTAPAASGSHSAIPPRRVGGNLDTRELRAGSTLYLPVEVAGALLSVGDTHAAQGDGEVCGTAIESAMDATLRIDLLRDEPLRFPRFETRNPPPGNTGRHGVIATTGVGPDLMTACRDAVTDMINHLARSRSMTPEDAYMLCSVAADLRITEVVDAPNWVVACAIPRALFTDRASV